MWANKDIFRRSIKIAKNHMDRAREGKKLLEEGRPLSEMKTSLFGLTAEDTLERRSHYLKFIGEMDESSLRDCLEKVELQIYTALNREEKGTSELEWQRNAIRQLLGEY